MDKFIRVFDRNHKILDELYHFDGLKYGWTLDDIDTAEFTLPINESKTNGVNAQFMNHVEIMDGDGIVWGGILSGRNFNGPGLKINCWDYNYLLKLRRMRVKTYTAMEYGAMMQQAITDCSAARPDYLIGLTGFNIATGVLKSTKTVADTDNLWSTLKGWGDDANYDYGVTPDRMYNFWSRRGADKPQYTLVYGSDADNITEAPEFAEDINSMANSVYGSSDSLTADAEDTKSQSLFGLVEGTYSPSGSADQSTLTTQTNSALQKVSYPAKSFTVTAKDSTLCPFDSIQVGDAVTVHLIPYFNFQAVIRIIRMVHDEKTQTREITFGSIIFRPQPPVKRLYKYWG